jgi:transposase
VKTYPLDFVLLISFLTYVYIRKIKINKDGKEHCYWALVESVRTARGPRQRVVAHLGEIDESGRLGIKQAANGLTESQIDLFNEEPEWVEINVRAIRTESVADFGDAWLAIELLKRLGLFQFFQQNLSSNREKISWTDMAVILVISRFCDPSSELYIAEHFYEHSALPHLLGVPSQAIYENRLYRAMDKLLPHKQKLEKHLKERFGELFDIHYDLLLYDITSTYFEGQANQNSQAQRGYSRDQRPDCKQVLIALVVTREGLPLGYEILAGNRHDSTTVQDIVNKIETQYGAADRIWVMDRGMTSKNNIAFLTQSHRSYIIGTPKCQLRQFERQLLTKDWQQVEPGVEVKCCPSADGNETFILCRSLSRKEKEQAMFERFKTRIEDGLQKIKMACEERRIKTIGAAERRIGRILQKNSRAARLFDVQVSQSKKGKIEIHWTKKQMQSDWAALSHGCYLLHSNITNWSPQELWRAYIHLTDVEEAFRIHKSDFELRPVWHQKENRVQAHILVCFLAFVLWKCLAQMCNNAGLGNEPRKIVDEFKHIRLTDVILPTKKGMEIKLHCISSPDEHQKILLQHLKMNLPSRLKTVKM